MRREARDAFYAMIYYVSSLFLLLLNRFGLFFIFISCLFVHSVYIWAARTAVSIEIIISVCVCFVFCLTAFLAQRSVVDGGGRRGSRCVCSCLLQDRWQEVQQWRTSSFVVHTVTCAVGVGTGRVY